MDHSSPRDVVVASVARRCGLYTHAGVFVVVNALLGVASLGSPGNTWFAWTIGGWAIGLAAHAVSVGLGTALAGWQERQVERELARRPS